LIVHVHDHSALVFGTNDKLFAVILLDVANVHDPTNVAVISVVPQTHSAAHKRDIRFPTSLFHDVGDTIVEYVYVLVVSVGTTLLNVYVAAFDKLLPSISFAQPDNVCAHGCC
jgi:hypothetical protein